MKNIMLSAVLSLMIAACSGQKRKEQAKSMNGSAQLMADTASNPKINVRVNRKYDDKGNLIRYDSTYSYYYASPEGQVKSIGGDTLYNNFKSFFRQRYDTLFGNNMNDIFLNDSLFGYDFFNKDYFSKRFEINKKSLEDMFRRMDSLKEDFLLRGYPQGRIEKKNQSSTAKRD
jgi:hypothetical protein